MSNIIDFKKYRIRKRQENFGIPEDELTPIYYDPETQSLTLEEPHPFQRGCLDGPLIDEDD